MIFSVKCLLNIQAICSSPSAEVWSPFGELDTVAASCHVIFWEWAVSQCRQKTCTSWSCGWIGKVPLFETHLKTSCQDPSSSWRTFWLKLLNLHILREHPTPSEMQKRLFVSGNQCDFLLQTFCSIVLLCTKTAKFMDVFHLKYWVCQGRVSTYSCILLKRCSGMETHNNLNYN